MLKKKRMTEQEFLAEWEKSHKKPVEREKQNEWELARLQALGHWLVQRELEENAIEQKKETLARYNRFKRHINNHILERQYDTYVIKEPCFLPGIKPYTDKMFETEPVFKDMAGMTAIATVEQYEMQKTMAVVMSGVLAKGLSEESCNILLREMLREHEQEYIRMRQECQCGNPEKVVDLVQTTMREMVRGFLDQSWNYKRMFRFMGNQMNHVFYQSEDENDPEQQCFKEKFKEKDNENVMQQFQAIRRMTELSVWSQFSMEKLKDKSHEKDFFTPQELRDFLLGSYVSNELKKSFEKKALTKEALRFGQVQVQKNEMGGTEVVYGDEKLYEEMMKSESYKKLSQMSIGEIRKMLRKDAEMEKAQQQENVPVRQQEKAPVRQEDRVMVLKPQNYD